MKKNDFKKAKKIKEKLHDQVEHIEALNKLFNTENEEGNIDVHIRGTKFKLPKKVFETELDNLIIKETKKLQDLEKEFKEI